jgi:hypothetical protein
MASKKTLVLGASDNPDRYSYKAIKDLRLHDNEVIAIGRRKSKVDDVEIGTQLLPIKDLDTVTLYLNAKNQKEYYDYILAQKPNRIIFNPGAENEELAQLAQENNIIPQEACTLVLLHTGQY